MGRLLKSWHWGFLLAKPISWRLIIIILLAILSLFFVSMGVSQNEPHKIYINARIICLDCIGIGK